MASFEILAEKLKFVNASLKTSKKIASLSDGTFESAARQTIEFLLVFSDFLQVETLHDGRNGIYTSPFQIRSNPSVVSAPLFFLSPLVRVKK